MPRGGELRRRWGESSGEPRPLRVRDTADDSPTSRRRPRPRSAAVRSRAVDVDRRDGGAATVGVGSEPWELRLDKAVLGDGENPAPEGVGETARS